MRVPASVCSSILGTDLPFGGLQGGFQRSVLKIPSCTSTVHPKDASRLGVSARAERGQVERSGIPHLTKNGSDTRIPVRGTTHGRVCGFLRRNKFSIKPRVGVWHGRKHHEKAGAPSFAFFAKGGDPRRWVSGLLVSHPSQKARRMGHPGDLLHFLPRTRNTPFHTPRAGNAGGRLRGKPHEVRRFHQAPQEIRGMGTRGPFTRARLQGRFLLSFWGERGAPGQSSYGPVNRR